MNRIFILVIVLFFAACNCPKNKAPEAPTVATEQEINTFVNAWHQAATDANGDAYFDKITEKGVFIGTDASEHWNKTEFYAFAKPYFDKGKAWSFTATERNVFYSADSSVIWFDELLDTWMGPCRSSGVIQTVNDSLKMEHYQLSVTVPNQQMDAFLGAVYPQNEE